MGRPDFGGIAQKHGQRRRLAPTRNLPHSNGSYMECLHGPPHANGAESATPASPLYLAPVGAARQPTGGARARPVRMRARTLRTVGRSSERAPRWPSEANRNSSASDAAQSGRRTIERPTPKSNGASSATSGLKNQNRRLQGSVVIARSVLCTTRALGTALRAGSLHEWPIGENHRLGGRLFTKSESENSSSIDCLRRPRHNGRCDCLNSKQGR